MDEPAAFERKRKIREIRRLQIPLLPHPSLAYKLNPSPIPTYRDAKGRKVDPTLWFQQPQRWPRRDHQTAEDRADVVAWRIRYEAQWIANRKADGLPHEILNPTPQRKK